LSGNRKQAYLQHNKYNMSIINKLLSYIAPHHCIGCNAEGALLCSSCLHGLRRVHSRCYICQRLSDDFLTCLACRKRTPLAHVWTYASYEGLAKELIHRLKFERAQAASYTIGRALADLYTGPSGTVVTSVPTANSRVRQRGYDQAALIGRELARVLRCPYLPLLAREGSLRQVGQERAVRKRQMQHVFRPLASSSDAPRRVLLVDDVITTGATCEVAARILREMGVKQVDVIVFAVA